MSRSDRDRLADILSAIDRCLRFRPHMDVHDETVAFMATDAILRNLAVVGEAASKLSDQTRDRLSSTPWPSIVGLRNVVVHEYFRIDLDVVRDVVDTEAVRLAADIRGLDDQNGSDASAPEASRES